MPPESFEALTVKLPPRYVGVGAGPKVVVDAALAMATDCIPTAPAAPALLETTTGCLSTRSSAAASGRPVRSATPPGGNGLTSVMGRFGYCSWARAPVLGRAAITGRTSMIKVERIERRIAQSSL